jgi:hypothetical protein
VSWLNESLVWAEHTDPMKKNRVRDIFFTIGIKELIGLV